jgi:V8-like Glu-specific endopeptidase
MKRFLMILLIVAFACSLGTAQENMKAGKFDTGKMWTFDWPPTEYFAKTYNFNPTKDWFEKARTSALRIPGCTASFVSEDGLVMTNHHCARGALDAVTKEGERLAIDGFYAATLADERKAPNMYADQLVSIEDVTQEVAKAYDSGKTDSAKVSQRTAKITEIQNRYWAKYKEMTKDSMVFSVVTFFNGGRYSLYGFHRYTDMRIVFAPEEKMAFFGGDPDNFTYPRYDFDCSFFRVYDSDGKPLKTQNFFKFSKNGAQDGDAVFVIGNPGTTNRLLTVAQLEYNRDFGYAYQLSALDNAKKAYESYIANHPDERLKYMTTLFGISNSQKAVTGYLAGHNDPAVMARKKDFEQKFQAAVNAKPELNDLRKKYGGVWKDLEKIEVQRRKGFWDIQANTYAGLSRSIAFSNAFNLVDYVMNMKLAEEQRSARFKAATLDRTKNAFFPASYNAELDKGLLAFQLDVMQKAFGAKNKFFNTLVGRKSADEAASSLLNATIAGKRDTMRSMLNGKPEDVLASADPLIAFATKTYASGKKVRDEWQKLLDKRSAKVQELGRAMYEVYGTSFPPDATFSLRISDGTVKSYEYNGTIAPVYTTIYGLYDRYYSFGKKDPFQLSDRWANPPADLNMSAPMNFISTNDIIGGNSGSAVVNKDLEVVGLIFDGNIESLPGNIIFMDEKNRSVSVHSAGLVEGLDKIYRAGRIVNELRTAKIYEEPKAEPAKK